MKHLTLCLATLLFFSCQSSDQQIQSWVEKNPEKIIKALMDYQQKKQAETTPTTDDVKANSTALFNNDGSPTVGKGPIKIAYFFDFNCGHCMRQSETMKEVLSKSDKVQIIFKNFAVLGPSSELAARAALAAHQQNKYYEFYSALIKAKDKNLASLKTIAKKLNLNVTKWEKDLDSDAVRSEIEHVNKLADKMKLSGTPAIAIAPDQIYPGRVDHLMQIIETLQK